MRRVKKRWYVLAIGIVLVTLFAQFAIDALSMTPSPQFNAALRIDELVRRVQPEGENSWPLYRAAMVERTTDADGVVTERARRYDWGEVWPPDVRGGSWADARHDVWRDHSAEWAEQIEVFIDATTRPGFRRVFATSTESIEVAPEVDPTVMPTGPLAISTWGQLRLHRTFADLLIAGIRTAAATDDWDEVVRLARAGLRSGRHRMLQGAAIPWLIGGGTMELMLAEMRYLLQERDVPPEVCRALLGVIGDAYALTPPLTHLAEVERVWWKDIWQWLYDANGRPIVWRHLRGENSPAVQPQFGDRISNLMWFAASRYSDSVAEIDAYFDELIKIIRGEVTDRSVLDALAASDKRVRIVAESIEGVVQWTQHFERKAAGTRVVLLLEIHHAEHGSWPSALADAMPVDETICPGTSVPFEFELDADRYSLSIPVEAPGPRGNGWESDDDRRLTAPRAPLREELN